MLLQRFISALCLSSDIRSFLLPPESHNNKPRRRRLRPSSCAWQAHFLFSRGNQGGQARKQEAGFLPLSGGVFVLRLWICGDAARVKDSCEDSALCCVTRLQPVKNQTDAPLVQRESELKNLEGKCGKCCCHGDRRHPHSTPS